MFTIMTTTMSSQSNNNHSNYGERHHQPLSVHQTPLNVDNSNLLPTSNSISTITNSAALPASNSNEKMQINTIEQLMSTKHDDLIKNNSQNGNQNRIHKMSNYTTTTNSININNKSFDQLSMVSSQSRFKPTSSNGILKQQHQQINNRLNKTSNSIYYDKIYNDTNPNKLQVQILPQQDWAPNNQHNMTNLTADLSDNDAMTEDGRMSLHSSYKFKHNNTLMNQDENLKSNRFSLKTFLSNHFGYFCSLFILICSFFSPILFIIIPRYLNDINNSNMTNFCGLECEGILIGISFKLFLILFGYLTLFGINRKHRHFMPRLYDLNTLIIFLILIMTFSYWLFYSVRIIGQLEQDYYKILEFTQSYVDVLLFVYIISIFLLKLRHMEPKYVVKIVRSPDGHQMQYDLGCMSIQRAACFILEKYYKDFHVYNHWLDNASRKRCLQLQSANTNKSTNGSVKSFNVQNVDETNVKLNANDRFYEEYEFERRLRKRRARLLTSTEEAFGHVKRATLQMDDQNDDDIKKVQILDPYETAQAIFTSIARDLRRYLRVTRQQPYYTRDTILAHLANCVSYDMSPKAFLQRFFQNEPLIFNERVACIQNDAKKIDQPNGIGSHGVNYTLNLKTADQSWILICDTVLYQNVNDNLMLVLKQNDVCLMCTFKKMPRFNLIEDILDPLRNKFVIKLNSETTV